MRAEGSLEDLPGMKPREWEAFEKAGFLLGQQLLDWLPNYLHYMNLILKYRQYLNIVRSKTFLSTSNYYCPRKKRKNL